MDGMDGMDGAPHGVGTPVRCAPREGASWRSLTSTPLSPSHLPFPPPHHHQHSGSRCGGCLASVPLFQLICTAVILAGTVIFSVKGGTAFTAVRELFEKLGVSAGVQAKATSAMSAILGAGIAVLLCMLVLSALSTLAAANGKRRRYRIRHGGSGELRELSAES